MCQNLFITSKVSERSKVKGQIQKSFSEISQKSNPLKTSHTCCKVQVFLISDKFLKGQNIF